MDETTDPGSTHNTVCDHAEQLRKELHMESINGATFVFPDPAGVEAEAERGPVNFGPGENEGAYVMMIGAAPKTDGPPLHIHPHTDEGFYIGDGEMTFLLDGREVLAPAGSFVYIPRGVPHTAWNSGPGPMRGLIILSPGTAEHIFEPVESEGTMSV